VIGEALRLYRAHWQHLLGIAAVVYLAVAVITLLGVALLGGIGFVVASLVSFVGLYWTQAALVEAVQDIRDGRADLGIGETFSRVRPRLLTVIGASLLAAIAIAIGLVLLIVPGLILLTWWCLFIPVIVLEGAGVFASFGRSRALVRGHGWNVFGVLVLAVLILIVAGLVLGVIVAPIDNQGVQRAVSNLVSGVVTAPFYALVATVLYFRLSGADGEGDVAPAPGLAPHPADTV
jgi:hypothetical protein